MFHDVGEYREYRGIPEIYNIDYATRYRSSKVGKRKRNSDYFIPDGEKWSLNYDEATFRRQVERGNPRERSSARIT